MSDHLRKAERRTAWHERRALAPLSVGWRHRELILAVLRRELADRFSGSALGWVWAVVGPLITLAIYTTTLTKAMQLPAASAHGGTSSYALSTFVGLIVFGLFAELCCRAPLLMHEHAWFLKTSIFPSETLAWTAVLRALSYAGISFLVLLVFYVVLNGIPPLSILLLPIIVAPLALFLLGIVWFLAAVGAFTRDISYLMITFVPLVMFATPVFYRVSDLPDALQVLAYANPLGTAIEITRAAVLDGVLPPTLACFGFLVVSLAVCRGGYAVFERYKGILVDVI
ncbi:MAG TPA: ABC transporter permease [Stellaceae bacterium]|jgi:lipopolysaccharide transport system permease protein|nr:ABC transporter permease [Stellaceae bacterium]